MRISKIYLNKIILILLVLLLVLILTIIISLNLIQSYNKVNNTIKTNPTSYNYASTPLASYSTNFNNISFSIKRPSININKPDSGDNLYFQSRTSIEDLKGNQLNSQTYILNSSKFTIVIGDNGEGTPVFGNIDPENIQLNTNYLNKVYKVKDSSVDYVKSINSKVDLRAKKYVYFYSSDYSTKCIDSGTYCGADYVILPQSDLMGEKPGVRIYCFVNNDSDSRYCDEFVKNLKVSLL